MALEFPEFAVDGVRGREARARAPGARVVADPEEDEDVGRGPRGQLEVALDGAASVVRELLVVAAGAPLDGQGPVKPR